MRHCVLGLIAFSVLASVVSAQSIQINRDNKTIAISTTDEASATADIASVTVGFDLYRADYESASVGSEMNLLPALEIRPQTIREEATVYAVFAIE